MIITTTQMLSRKCRTVSVRSKESKKFSPFSPYQLKKKTQNRTLSVKAFVALFYSLDMPNSVGVVIEY